MAKEVKGQWTDLPDLSNVAVHASLLPTGKVLYWGRRQNPKSTDKKSLDEHFTKAFLWNPSDSTSIPTANEPLGTDGQTVNLFCSGHCFLPDGRLLIVGGHIVDGQGVNQACIYDPGTNTFNAETPMFKGRWYPSALTLPDGRALVISGSDNGFVPFNIPQIWPSDNPDSTTWAEVTDPLSQNIPALNLYPRIHISPKGHVFMAGPQIQSCFLKIRDANGAEVKTQVGDKATDGSWEDANTSRQAGFRDYAPSVMYDSGKVMYIGGGDDSKNEGPTNMVEFIDLNDAQPKWTSSPSTNMKFPRRQFNATILPDGTVLVTGGTQGPGFNNLSAGSTVHQAELWDPVANQWTEMAAEKDNRCYHSTALLLPDGRVLSAGSGEYGDATPADCLTTAQLFEPPYLFRGVRPVIATWPSEISYGKDFTVNLGNSDPIDKISWMRLGSVTHCRNMNQSLMFLSGFRQTGPSLTVPAPANANLAPPGHYMLFVLSKQAVPSEGRIIHISSLAPASKAKNSARLAAHVAATSPVQPSLRELNERIITEQGRPPVAVGLTPLCPYGLGPCWGGAYDALRRMSDVDVVRPVPNHDDSIAFVYLKQDILPDIDKWRREFESVANRSYDMRGIEMTISGVVTKRKSGADEQMILAGASTRSQLTLAPFQEASQLRWDVSAKAPKPVSEREIGAYEQLSATMADHIGGIEVQVTGTLQKHGDGEFSLDVRDFEVLNATAS